MSPMMNLRDVERRAWTLYFEDGLWDMFFGLMFLGGGLRSLTDSRWFYLLNLAGVLLPILGKRWITVPRLGQITYGSTRQARLNVVRLIGLVMVIYTVVILAMILGGADLSGIPVGWIFVFIVPGVFLLMAYMMDFTRLYGYTVLITIFMVLSETTGDPAAAWAQIIAGLVPLAVGLVLLARFLREYPVVDEAALADVSTEEADNGHS